MNTSAAYNWDRIKQTFADQFEQDGSRFVYRRSQKGEAIAVSADERSRFIDEFDGNVRRSKWILYLGMTVSLGGAILFSVLSHSDVSELAIVAAIVVAMIPYFVFYRWAWVAPTRELAGRTPIAGERSPDEVRRLKFRRISYGQLALAALSGLLLPFFFSARLDVFSGWNRLWLAFGVAIILLAVVQAFRKWRFEQEDSCRNVISPPAEPTVGGQADDSSSPVKAQLWRYIPLALILIAFPFIAYTSAGRQLAKQPSFWSIAMIGGGGWALFTVVRGFTKGQIEPFLRGFSNTYVREAQPKRFWASMGWNSIFGCLCFWLAFMMNGQASARAAEDRCLANPQNYAPQAAISACDQIINRKVKVSGWSTADALVGRGIAYDGLKDRNHAIADYSEALRLKPDDFYAYLDRGIAYGKLNERQLAISDFSDAIALKADPGAYSLRGYVYAQMGNMPAAVSDFSQAIRLTPSNARAYYYRALAYHNMGDTQRATTDFDTAFRLDPKLCRGCRRSD